MMSTSSDLSSSYDFIMSHFVQMFTQDTRSKLLLYLSSKACILSLEMLVDGLMVQASLPLRQDCQVYGEDIGFKKPVSVLSM